MNTRTILLEVNYGVHNYQTEIRGGGLKSNGTESAVRATGEREIRELRYHLI